MKIFTTACLLGSLILCFILVWLFGEAANPHNTKAEKLLTLQRMELTILLIIFCAIGATTGAFLIVRGARKAYREEAMANMQGLVEEFKAKDR